MGAPELLLEALRGRGFRLRAGGGRLLVSPRDCLTDEDREAVRAHREALVTLLEAEAAELAATRDRLRRMSPEELAASIGDFGVRATLRDGRLVLDGEPEEPLRPIDGELWRLLDAEAERRESPHAEARAARVGDADRPEDPADAGAPGTARADDEAHEHVDQLGAGGDLAPGAALALDVFPGSRLASRAENEAVQGAVPIGCAVSGVPP